MRPDQRERGLSASRSAGGDETGPELERLAALLDRLAAAGRTLTYQQAAERLELDPPHVIHRITQLLERLMDIDAGNGRPLRAALVVSKVRGGRPAPGFFDKARELGIHGGDDDAAFHRGQLEALYAATAGCQG